MAAGGVPSQLARLYVYRHLDAHGRVLRPCGLRVVGRIGQQLPHAVTRPEDLLHEQVQAGRVPAVLIGYRIRQYAVCIHVHRRMDLDPAGYRLHVPAVCQPSSVLAQGDARGVHSHRYRILGNGDIAAPAGEDPAVRVRARRARHGQHSATVIELGVAHLSDTAVLQEPVHDAPGQAVAEAERRPQRQAPYEHGIREDERVADLAAVRGGQVVGRPLDPREVEQSPGEFSHRPGIRTAIPFSDSRYPIHAGHLFWPAAPPHPSLGRGGTGRYSRRLPISHPSRWTVGIKNQHQR